LEDFSILCDLVVEAGLGEILAAPGTFTVFAPTNAAFQELLSDPDVATAVENKDFLRDVLLYHVIVEDDLKKLDLKCSDLYDMANGDPTRHVCMDGKRFQRGSGNFNDDPPEIT
jgi:uncharacterized surface protein with fasciclin (FAS1) repeats